LSRPARDDQARLQYQIWSLYELADLPGVAAVTYGVVRTGRHDPQGIPLLQARDIVDGAIVQNDPARIAEHIHAENPRSWLERDDLVIVLVGRIGDSALVGEDQAGWNAARSVGVVRFTEVGRAWGVDIWLRRWLKAPGALEWLNRHAPGSAHATLPISALKKLPVLLPPLDRRRHLLHGIDLIEQRRHLNTQIAAHAIELADAQFERSSLRHAGTSRRPLAEVAAVINGVALPKMTTGQAASIAWAAPAEVLQSLAPYLDRTARTMPAPEHQARAPAVVLIAPRPGEVKAVMSRIPVVPGRGTAALRAGNDVDGLWLLHELRSRSRDLGAITQGTQAREISVKALSRLKVSWPDTEVRRSFARVASLLHDRAYAALKENHVLGELISTDINEGVPSQYRTAMPG
jgi:hypothetical protein